MRKSKITPSSTAVNTNTIKSADDALKQKYSQYNLSVSSKILRNNTSNSNPSESESFQKQSFFPRGVLSPQSTPNEILTEKEEKNDAPTDSKRFFQKKGRNEKKKRLSYKINDVNAKEEDDVQLNLKINPEQRKLSSILVKEYAAYCEPVPGSTIREDKFGNQIDHKQKKQKISFNEDITVHEVENWKKFNNRMYDEDEERCACNILQTNLYLYVLAH